MSRIAYVNGRYLPRAQAKVTIEDRGYQFADGVYEVCEVRAGRLVDERRHMARLDRSLGELRIARADVAGRARRRAARNGAAQPRARRHRLSADHPRRGAARLCLSAARYAEPRWSSPRAALDLAGSNEAGGRGHRRDHRARHPLGAASTSSRWRCCPTCWPSRRRASRARAKPGWSMRNGRVTEGASSNAWIVSRDGKLVTRPLGHDILPRHHPLGACST